MANPLDKLSDPEFQKDFEQLSKDDQDSVLASMGVSRTTKNLAPFINPDINKPVRKIDRQGADLPNRQQNDPRLIQPQDIGTDQGVIPGVQTGAGIAAGLGTPLGVLGDLASPAIATMAANAPKIKAALTGAALGAGGDLVMGGKHPILAALEGAATGTVGNKILSNLLKRFGPEAETAATAATPKGGVTQTAPIAPTAIPQVGGSTFNPQVPTPPIQAPNTPATLIGGGSTLGALTQRPPVTPPTPPAIQRDLFTGRVLPKGVNAAEKAAADIKNLTPKQIQDALEKLRAKQEAESGRQQLLKMMGITVK